MTSRWFPVLVCAVVATSCGHDTEAARRKYFESGNQFFNHGKFAEAIVEYRNALREDPNFGEARLKLADAYTEARDPAHAYREYIRAADLMPNNTAAQMKAANTLLFAGQFEDAKSRVDRVLAKDPKDTEALIVRGSALAGLHNLDGAVQQLEDAIQVDPNRALTYTNLAFLKLASGARAEARAAFVKAVELDPKSVPAALALANFYWASGEIADAEAMLKKALAGNARDVVANRALATLYLGTGRPAQAEEYLKAVAAITPEPPARFALADYYRATRRLPDAKAILQPMVSDKRTFADAKTRLSEIEYAGGNAAGGHAMLKDVLAAQPKYAPALMVQADWLLHEGQPADALRSATAAVAADGRSTRAHYLVGLIQAALYDTEAAAAAFREVLRLNPNVVAAQVQLSRLELQQGHTEEAAQLAAEAAKSAPDSPNTRLTMARTLIAQRDIPRAEAAVAALVKDYPRAAAVHVAQGSLALAKHDITGARASFERALALDATSFTAFNGLVSADVIQKNLSSARARVDERMRTGTPGPDLLLLASRVYIAAGDPKAAEGTLRRLIEVAPANAVPFSMLAQVYVAQGKLPEAQAEFDKLAARDPKDVASRLMGAFIAHARQDLPDASKRYESVLEIDPNAAAAANNLAWILADAGDSLDRALRLAETATRVSPDTAEYNDTVGWVYLKKQLPSLAVTPFERAVSASPDNPTFAYHLGMANAAAGNASAARTALTKALAARTPFPAAADARNLLASLR